MEAHTAFIPCIIRDTVPTVSAKGYVVQRHATAMLTVRQYLGPDSKETITFTTPEYCASCKYWFKDGAQHRQ